MDSNTKNEELNITQFSKGLNTDFSPQVQPQGTYRFALNAVNEAELGDTMFLSNEEGNEISVALPTGFVPIGKRYIGEGNTIIFLVNKTETISKIVLFNEEGSLETLVDDTDSTDKLTFKLAYQIDCVYRLRRGNERTIYFTDNYNPPRYFNLDKDYIFKGADGNFNASLFRLFRSYKTIPTFDDISIVAGGALPSGSYNVAIQYIDSDLNPTEWMNVTDTIIIYNDDTNKAFHLVRGSTNEVNSYQNFGPTSKAIQVIVGNLDNDFKGYRLALIEANNGSGNINKISVSELISIKEKTYIFTGTNTVENITESEIKAFANSVERVAHIEQLENKLLLANVKGKTVDWSKLQRAASKIKSNLVLKEVVLNDVKVDNNPKNGIVNTEDVGYMPGEIYSFGIVWVFKDGSTSPAFHIPGRDTIASEDNLMSTDNKCAIGTYEDFSTTSQQITEANNITITENFNPNEFVINENVEANDIELTRVEINVVATPSVELVGGANVPVSFYFNESTLQLTAFIDSVYISSKPIKLNWTINYLDTSTIPRILTGTGFIDPGDTTSIFTYALSDFINFSFFDSVVAGECYYQGTSHTSNLKLTIDLDKYYSGKTFTFIFIKNGSTIKTQDVYVDSTSLTASEYLLPFDYDSYTVDTEIVPIQIYTLDLENGLPVETTGKLRFNNNGVITSHNFSFGPYIYRTAILLEEYFTVEPIVVIDTPTNILTLNVTTPENVLEGGTIKVRVTDTLGTNKEGIFTFISGSKNSTGSLDFLVGSDYTITEISRSFNPGIYNLHYVAEHSLIENIIVTGYIKADGLTVKTLTTNFSQGTTSVYTSYFNKQVGLTYTYAISTDKPCIHIVGNTPQDGTDFWGVDYNDNPLLGEQIRHHRFPLRSEIGEPLLTDTVRNRVNPTYTLMLEVSPKISGNTIVDKNLVFSVSYKLKGVTKVSNFSYLPLSTLSSKEQGYYDRAGVFHSSITHFNTTGNIYVNLGITSDEAITDIVTTITTPNPNTTLTVVVGSIDTGEIEKIDTVKTSNIFGIEFSNINLPSVNETGGYEVIGYYIVRNQRTETEKTILDNGILTPLLVDGKNPSRFNSFGFLAPALNYSGDFPIKKDVVGLINPEFKFNKIEYKNFSLIHEGNFIQKESVISELITQDVQAGTSYDPAKNSGSADSDGFDLHTLSRDNIVEYSVINNNENKLQNTGINDINEVFYLNALSYKNVTDSNNVTTPIYNITSDNKVGIVSFKQEIDNHKLGLKFPYVIMKNNLVEHYSTFRSLPYYLETKVQLPKNLDGTVKTTNNSTQVFNGDSYISPMKYQNTLFHSLSIAKRPGKTSWWKYLIAGVAIVAAAALTVLTLGAAAPLVTTGVLIAADLLLAGAAVTMSVSGLETDNLNRVYNEEYEKGLKYAVEDNTTKSIFGTHDSPHPGADDEIRWFGESISDLWFESSINMNWRKGSTIGLTDFLNAPYDLTRPNGSQYVDGNLNTDYKAGELDTYLLNKLTTVDSKQNNGRLYKGYAGAEIYEVNKDYLRRNREKVFFALGIEYDSRSKHSEEFPTRIMYSEQAFQEEVTDNYKIFLPNNYKDIDGETGPITNMFKIQNSLFVHTREALWNIPKNYQERVTDQIVSFLGTGSYFEIPPQKMIDDESGNSAGTSHKWGSIKTQHGYFFPCEKQNCFYMFDGKSMKPISDNGLQNELYFKIPLQINTQLLPGLEYLHSDNPSNPIGVGYIATYDSKKERILFTKKDFLLTDTVTKVSGKEGDFILCMDNGSYYYIAGYYNIIKTRELGEDVFLGIVGHSMKFLKSADVVGVAIDNPFLADISWTLSYSLKTQSWTSWHSYLPSFYLHTSQNFFSWNSGDVHIWKHNSFGKYQSFYGVIKPFIIEYVSLGNPMINKVWESLELVSEAKKYDFSSKQFLDVKAFFNKAILYNSKQCSGNVSIITKDDLSSSYISNQAAPDTISNIIADRNERNWTMNNLRDFRIDYTKPIFKSDIASVASEYFIDKVVNSSTINLNKDWTELESFRDKYLVVRLIFDTFANPSADIKLLINYSIENEKQSFR